MKQINKNTIWNAVGNTVFDGTQWLMTAAVARYGGFGTAGIMAVAMSVSLIFRTITYFGVRNYQISDEDKTFDDSEYFNLRIITSVSSLLICVLCSLVLGYRGEEFAAILIYMVFRITEGFTDLIGGYLQKAGRLDLAGILLSIKAAATAALFFIVFFFSGSLIFSVTAMTISSVIVLIFIEFHVSLKYIRYDIKKRTLQNNISVLFRKMMPALFPVFLQTAEISVIFNLPKICLSYFSDNESIGVYSSVFSLTITIHAAFRYIYTPYLTEYSTLLSKNDQKSASKLIYKISIILTIVSALFICLWTIFGESLLTAVYGASELYRHITVPTVISCCAYSAMSFAVIIAVVKRKIKTIMISCSVGTAAAVIFSFLFTAIFGINGVSYGMIVGCLVIILTTRFCVHKI